MQTPIQSQGSKVLVAYPTKKSLTFTKTGTAVTFTAGEDLGVGPGDVISVPAGTTDLAAGDYEVTAVDGNSYLAVATGSDSTTGSIAAATVRVNPLPKNVNIPTAQRSAVAYEHLGSTFSQSLPSQLTKWTQLTFGYTRIEGNAAQEVLEDNIGKLLEFDAVRSDGYGVRFTGFVSGLPQTWDTDAHVTVQATVEIYSEPVVL